MATEKGIYKQLKDDHEGVSKLMDRLANMSESDGKRSATFAEIRDALKRHTEAEEKVFYSRLRDEEGAHDLVLEAREEHEEVEALLAELETGDHTTDEWAAKFAVLKENVEHHVEEEENELFPEAKRILGKEEAERLGKEFEREKKAVSL